MALTAEKKTIKFVLAVVEVHVMYIFLIPMIVYLLRSIFFFVYSLICMQMYIYISRPSRWPVEEEAVSCARKLCATQTDYSPTPNTSESDWFDNETICCVQ